MTKKCHGTKSFKRDRIIAVNYSQFSALLNNIKSRGGKIYLAPYKKILYGSIGFDGYLEDKLKFCILTCKYQGEYASFIFDKSTGSVKEASRITSQGMNAYQCLVRMLDEEGKKLLNPIVSDYDLTEGKNLHPFSTAPFLYKNDKYEGIENKAVGYDMNSAYSYAMLQPIPDTRELTSCKIVDHNPGILQEGQIGFTSKGDLVEVGEYAQFRFKAVPSPFAKFVNYYYNLKATAKKPDEKERSKRILNLAVGYLQRKNPFLRATIVSRANNIIKSLMDEHTIYCNTDSIVSIKERPELELGFGIGQWKVEHKGTFKYIGMNYQWNKSLPSYRGMPKEWFPKGWDILKNELPTNSNKYEFDYKELMIKRRR